MITKYPISTALAACWTTSAVLLTVLPASDSVRMVEASSNSLSHVARWPLTLLISGLLVREDLALWLLALAFGVAVFEARAGWRVTLVSLAAAQALSTAVAQVLLALRVHFVHAPALLLDQVDVGPSYLAACGLALAVVVAGSLRQRTLAAVSLALALPQLLEGIGKGDLAAMGHLTAVVIGLAQGWWLLRRPAPVFVARHAADS